MRWMLFCLSAFVCLAACELVLPPDKKFLEPGSKGDGGQESVVSSEVAAHEAEAPNEKVTPQEFLPHDGSCSAGPPDAAPEAFREFQVPKEPSPCQGPCAYEGSCTRLDSRCVATSDADCRASFACHSQGRCKIGDGERCVISSEADCRASRFCWANGACAFKDGACKPGSDADCDQSQDCRERGACALTPQGCQPTKDSHCAASLGCRQTGACGVASNPSYSYCAVQKTDHCLCSDLCRTKGYCVAYKGSCHTTGKDDAACATQDACAENAWCTAKDGACIAATDADCQRSKRCYCGHCFLRSENFCGPRDSKDCTQSQACLKEKRCCIIGHGSCN